LAWITGLLVGYWAALKFIPVPEFGAGDLAPGHTLTDFIDRTFLPGRLYKGDRDPEGILGTVPAVATALAGAVTGQFLKKSTHSGYVKSAAMAAVGLVCLGLAWLWNLDFPINKNLWSSSFVLHCAGWSLLLLAFFYLVVDVWRWRRWALLFIVIGSNSIFIYMAQRLVDFQHTTHFLFDGMLEHTGPYQPLLWAVALLAVKWLLLYVLYRHKIFVRV
jgi:predicted acyltransferase